MRRVPCSHSSTSALLLSPLIYLGSAPGYSARICQSSSVIRCILKVTRGLPIPPNMPPPAQAASPKSQGLIGAALFKLTHHRSRRLLIDLPGVGDNPIQGLLLGGKTIDAALVALVIADDDVPAGALFVGKGQHHGLFFFGVRHGADYARFGQGRKPKSGLLYSNWPVVRTARKFCRSAKAAWNKDAFSALRICQSTQWVGNVTRGSGRQLPVVRGLLCRDCTNRHGFSP